MPKDLYFNNQIGIGRPRFLSKNIAPFQLSELIPYENLALNVKFAEDFKLFEIKYEVFALIFESWVGHVIVNYNSHLQLSKNILAESNAILQHVSNICLPISVEAAFFQAVRFCSRLYRYAIFIASGTLGLFKHISKLVRYSFQVTTPVSAVVELVSIFVVKLGLVYPRRCAAAASE